jgi:hypothetical protein
LTWWKPLSLSRKATSKSKKARPFGRAFLVFEHKRRT